MRGSRMFSHGLGLGCFFLGGGGFGGYPTTYCLLGGWRVNSLFLVILLCEVSKFEFSGDGRTPLPIRGCTLFKVVSYELYITEIYLVKEYFLDSNYFAI